LNLGGKPGHRGGERRAEVSALSTRDEVAPARGMEEDLDALHGTILLKPNNGVNRPRKAEGGPTNGCVGSFSHPFGHICVMGVKDYLHF
jgi:hypothetical protein